MFINRNGEKINMIGEPIQIEDNAVLKKSWVVRLITTHPTPYGMKKAVIGEEPFENEPSDKQIMWCLAKYTNAEFAVKEQIFKLDSDLPF